MQPKTMIRLLSLVAALPSLVIGGGFSVDSASGLNAEQMLEDGATITIWLHLTHDYTAYPSIASMDNGWHVYDYPDGSLSWESVDAAKNPDYNWSPADGFPCMFDMGFYINFFDDTVGFGSVNFLTGTGMEYGFDDWAYKITVGPLTVNVEPDELAELRLDSCSYRPSNEWLWSASLLPAFKPDWVGVYCWSTINQPYIASPTGVEALEGAPLPDNFVLRQNYPNPFNPNTRMCFEIPCRSHVSLVVYNMLGQKVRTLADEVRSAGSYVVEWDGRNDAGKTLSTGIYLYRLEAGDFAQTKKAILMK